MAAARQQVRQWLDALGWPVEHAEDIELAVNEATANVVDHAYPPDAAMPPPCTPGYRSTRAPASAESSSRSKTAAAGPPTTPTLPCPTPAVMSWS